VIRERLRQSVHVLGAVYAYVFPKIGWRYDSLSNLVSQATHDRESDKETDRYPANRMRNCTCRRPLKRTVPDVSKI
jgi:hypothetical protein